MAVRGRRLRLARLRGGRPGRGQSSRVGHPTSWAHEREADRPRDARRPSPSCSLLSLHAGALGIRPDLSSDEVARAARSIRASAHQALQDLREVIGVLRAPVGELPQPTFDEPVLVEDSREAGASGSTWSWTAARTVAAARRAYGVPDRAGGIDQRTQARARRAGPDQRTVPARGNGWRWRCATPRRIAGRTRPAGTVRTRRLVDGLTAAAGPPRASSGSSLGYRGRRDHSGVDRR